MTSRSTSVCVSDYIYITTNQLSMYLFQVSLASLAGQEVKEFRESIPLEMAQEPWNYTASAAEGKIVSS